MRKTLPFSLLLTGLALFLAGCASAATPAQATATPSPTPASAASTPTPAAAAAHCTVTSLEATVEPTTASLFPPPGASDWTAGPASAPVTFIEYGDFM